MEHNSQQLPLSEEEQKKEAARKWLAEFIKRVQAGANPTPADKGRGEK